MNSRAAARGVRPDPMRPLRITRRANPSRTRPPAVRADAHLWPDWTDDDVWTATDPSLPLFERVERGGGS